ncbi:unnamed protein product, partial [Heterotrigona itama]
KRVEVFLEMLEVGEIDKVSVDADQADALLHLLDAVVIKLEGGTEEDLQVLDAKPTNMIAIKEIVKDKEDGKNKAGVEKKIDNSDATKLDEVSRTEKNLKNGQTTDAEMKSAEKDETSMEEIEKTEENIEETKKEDNADGADTTGKADVSNENIDAQESKEDDRGTKGSSEPPPEAKKSVMEPEAVIDLASEDKEKEPRALHKTSSIFLRNLAPTITKAEVEAMCKRFPGFLRVAIADPQPERRWFRRGWVSFERQVNIKEICWSLNNIRLRDCELGAIVNRDLSRRIRTVNGLTSHKQIVRHDIKLSAKIVHNLDSRVGLWNDEKKDDNTLKQDDDNKENKSIQNAFGLSSKNPVLKNITDYLIEEASAEEEELLGMSGDKEEGQLGGDGDGPIERDPSLIKVLDRLILYLRIVHSVDYYNHCEYPNEDEMPNRCGIMHVRGSPPTAKVTITELSEYCRNFESKMAAFLQPVATLSQEEYDKLGAKNAEAEVEKFVQANTQELSKDKWLCPLSGKKFKGPDFIRKHIFNKHAEKVAEVKAEAEYFNNYLRDPKRPQLPEHPGNKAPPRESIREGFTPYGCTTFGSYGPGYGGSRGGYGSSYGTGFSGGFGIPRSNRGGFNRGR